MKYLKVSTNLTKEEAKQIENKIKELGYKGRYYKGRYGDFKIDIKSLKQGYIYLYRGLSDKIMSQYCQSPHRWIRQLKDAEAYGEEITMEEFLKL